ncbi:MAG: hypothetical protein RJA46_28 [Pseudomonadota bacterium]
MLRGNMLLLMQHDSEDLFTLKSRFFMLNLEVFSTGRVKKW